MQLYHQMVQQDLGRSYCKMTLYEKIKTIENKLKQNKTQNKYTNLLEKVATIKIFGYFPVGSDLKKQTGEAKIQYQKL